MLRERVSSLCMELAPLSPAVALDDMLATGFQRCVELLGAPSLMRVARTCVLARPRGVDALCPPQPILCPGRWHLNNIAVC